MVNKMLERTFQRCSNTHEIFCHEIMQILTSPDWEYKDVYSQRHSSTKCNKQKSMYSCIQKFPCSIPRYCDEAICDQEHTEPIFIRLQSRVLFGIGGTKSCQSQR